MPDIRATVCRELKRRGWSKYQLAKACARRGVHESSVYNWLRGERGISVATLEAILTTLDMAVLPRDPEAMPESPPPTPEDDRALLEDLLRVIHRRLGDEPQSPASPAE